ncbi:MAG: hypothetical protein KJZ78_10605 [Bryobacteraceae bacterium]|nr:hypothetical protein [Bryobacteraceae bacterium]
MPLLNTAWGARVIEVERLYLDLLADYPPLRDHVHVFVSDTQGPLDTAHLLWGGEIYIAMHEEPELVHRLLDLILR